MDTPEDRLSDYIDALNEERDPERNLGFPDTLELARLLATARLVRSLRKLVLPGPDYPQRLAEAVSGSINSRDPVDLPTKAASEQKLREQTHKKASWWRRRLVLSSAAVVIAVAILVVFLANGGGVGHRDVAYAMEQAVSQLSSYHGVMEVRIVDAAGKEVEYTQQEIWWQGGKEAIRLIDETDGQKYKGMLVVNNGERYWQVRPWEKTVVLMESPPLLATPPAPDLGALQYEAERALHYPHAVIGSEVIGGRQTEKLRISPPGGLSYFLWVDTQTDLPIQAQMPQLLGDQVDQVTSTYLSFQPNASIDPAIFTYNSPAGYRAIDSDPKQLVANAQQAAAVSGLTPLLPQQAPNRIFAYEGEVILDYGGIVFTETAAVGSTPLDEGLDGNYLVGTAAAGPLHVFPQGNEFRWCQQGIDLEVEGSQFGVSQIAEIADLARQIAPDLTLPDPTADLVGQAKIKVAADLAGAKADQLLTGQSYYANVETSPLQVAFFFVNSKLSPPGTFSVTKPSTAVPNGGIPKLYSGTPAIPSNSFSLVANNGVEAVVAVTDGQISKVYLKRLVRQDESGVWSVVGYDPR
jgi:outer membrane lipoprotein-sorting protein